MTLIHFGTDGFRAKIADNFTFDTVRIIAQALAEYVSVSDDNQSGIAVSYDTRFLSSDFARTIAETIASNNIPVYLSETFTTTPMLSYAVKVNNLSAGIMVTASHNPCFYNGVKFKDAYGGPALPGFTQQIQKLLYKKKAKKDPLQIRKNLHYSNFYEKYFSGIRNLINPDAVRDLSYKIIYDSMYGAGTGYLDRLIKGGRLQLNSIHNEHNPLFGNRPPEPVTKNLTDLKKHILKQKADMGLATDGDGDRFAVLDKNGNFIQLHDLFAIFYKYFKTCKDWHGAVIRSTSMAGTVDKIAVQHGDKVIEVPVGFKNISEKMLTENFLIGGEESGGFGFKGFIPERDGLLSCLFLLEMISISGKSIEQWVKDLRNEFGPFYYDRIDAYHDLDKLKSNIKKISENPPDQIAGFKTERVNRTDGIKFYFSQSTWMLIRVSDTEPLFRIYAASDNKETVDLLLNAGNKLIKSEKL